MAKVAMSISESNILRDIALSKSGLRITSNMEMKG